MIQVPPGFSAKTATAAEDSAYGVSPAPSPLSFGYSAWQKIADGTYPTVTKRPYLVVTAQPLTQPEAPTNADIGSNTSVDPTTNWAGYGQSGSGWTKVQTEFMEPYLANTNCANPQVGFWDGIGNEPNALGQDGTGSPGKDGVLHEVWYENLPAGAAFPGVTAPAGSDVIATTTYDGNDHWGYAIAVNGHNYSYSGTGGYDGSVAEVITERPDGAPLLNFGSITMYAADAKGLGPMSPNLKWTMSGYATVGPFSDGSFMVKHDNCQG